MAFRRLRVASGLLCVFRSLVAGGEPVRGFSQILRHILPTAMLIAALLTTAGGKTLESQETAIGALTAAPDTFKGRNVVISGILKPVETDYFSAPQFVLTDTSGQAVSVSPWAPLE